MQRLIRIGCSSCHLFRANSLVRVQSALTHGVHTSSQSQQRNFISQFWQKLREEYQQSKDLRDSMKKFSEEKKKLEKSDELQKMRQYYKKMEGDTDDLKKRLQDTFEKNAAELRQKMSSLGDEKVVRETREALGRLSETVESAAKQLGDAKVVQAMRDTLNTFEHELADRHSVYCAPLVLKKREDLAASIMSSVETNIQPNESAQDIVVHKDARWREAWDNFKQTSTVAQRIFSWRAAIEESDSPLARSTRFLTEKVSSLLGSMWTTPEISTVLTEISRVDPNFELESFLRSCRAVLVPNILEAYVRGDADVLRSWCHDAPFSLLTQPFKDAALTGRRLELRVLDVSQPDVLAAKMMEQGPVLVIAFVAQQTVVVRDAKTGNLVEGNPDKVLRVQHVWALCRDEKTLMPAVGHSGVASLTLTAAAWKLLDIQMSMSEQFL